MNTKNELLELWWVQRELRYPDYARRMRSVRRFWAIGIAAVVLAGCGLQQDIADRVSGGVTVTVTAAPALSGTSLDGKAIDLASLRGHPVVVEFWGSWCVPCREEAPDINKLASDYTARGVHMVGVDMRDDRAEAQGFVDTYHVSYPSVFDPSSAIAAVYDVVAPPTTVVIDSKGQIRGRFLGTISGVSSLLDQLLRE